MDKAREKGLDAKQVYIVPSPYQTLQLPSAGWWVSLRLQQDRASPATSSLAPLREAATQLRQSRRPPTYLPSLP